MSDPVPSKRPRSLADDGSGNPSARESETKTKEVNHHMLTRTEPVTIVGYADWNIRGKKATRADGTVAEYMEFTVKGEFEARKVTLDPSINGNRLPAGATAVLDIDMVPEPVSRPGQDGRHYVAWRDKLTIRAMAPAKP